MQGLSTDETLETLIYGLKYGTLCKGEMQQFNKARLSPNGGAGNPEAAEAQVSNFLQCVHDVTRFSKSNCQNQYSLAFQCMQGSLERNGENECRSVLEDFTNCREQ